MNREYNAQDNGEMNETIDSTVSDLKVRASEFGSKVRETVGQVGSSVAETAGRQRQNAAGGLDRVASTLHESAGSIAAGGRRAEKVTHQIANGMESTASYLRDHDFKAMGEDVVGICRRHPAQALVSALAIGFLMGRAIRR